MPPRQIQNRRLICNKLTREIFNFSKTSGICYECPICLEKIDCVHCLVILNCGCACKMHAKCYLQLDASTLCPVCKS